MPTLKPLFIQNYILQSSVVFRKETNVNGHSLIQIAAENDLFLANTKFQQKPSQRSTWTSSYQPYRTKNGEIRKNPIRNQIDYILIDKRHLQFVTDAKSINNIKTETDHNMVIMKVKLQLSKLHRIKKDPTTPQINTDNLKKPEYGNSYRQEIMKIQCDTPKEKCANNNEKWLRVLDTC